MSRPEPKPTTLSPLDLQRMLLAMERVNRQNADLAAVQARLQLAQHEYQSLTAELAASYQIGDGDGIDPNTGAIHRKPVSARDVLQVAKDAVGLAEKAVKTAEKGPKPAPGNHKSA